MGQSSGALAGGLAIGVALGLAGGWALFGGGAPAPLLPAAGTWTDPAGAVSAAGLAAVPSNTLRADPGSPAARGEPSSDGRGTAGGPAPAHEGRAGSEGRVGSDIGRGAGRPAQVADQTGAGSGPSASPARAARRPSLALRVLDPDGAPAEVEAVRAAVPDSRGTRFEELAREGAPDGVSRVALPEGPGRALAAGSGVLLKVVARGLGDKLVELREPLEQPLTVRYEYTARLKTVVLGYARSAVEGRLGMSLEKRGGVLGGLYIGDGGKGTIGPDGRGELPSAPPGDYDLLTLVRVLVKQGEGVPVYIVAARQPVALRAGEQTETLPLPVLHRLSVRVESPRAGDSVRLRVRISDRPTADDRLRTILASLAARWSWEAAVGADGSAIFENIPPGAFQASLVRDGAEIGSAPCRVPEQTEAALGR